MFSLKSQVQTKTLTYTVNGQECIGECGPHENKKYWCTNKYIDLSVGEILLKWLQGIASLPYIDKGWFFNPSPPVQFSTEIKKELLCLEILHLREPLVGLLALFSFWYWTREGQLKKIPCSSLGCFGLTERSAWPGWRTCHNLFVKVALIGIAPHDPPATSHYRWHT